jgi:DNA mismatch repair ATPase MutS
MHDRKVSRVITPGTLIDENFIDPFSNNYVLAIHTADSDLNGERTQESQVTEIQRLDMTLGLAWLDLSIGQFFTQSTKLSALPSFLARIGPREIVLDDGLQASKEHGLFSVLVEDNHLITYMAVSEITPISEWTPMLESPVSSQSLNEFLPEEIAAGSALLKYVETRLQSSSVKLQPPSRQSNVMGIDKNTMTALEVNKTIRDGLPKGSLLNTIRRTATKGGARLLQRWLSESILWQVCKNRLTPTQRLHQPP